MERQSRFFHYLNLSTAKINWCFSLMSEYYNLKLSINKNKKFSNNTINSTQNPLKYFFFSFFLGNLEILLLMAFLSF